MLVTVGVAYSTLFGNGTLSVVSPDTTWSDENRLVDFFIDSPARTAGAPTGLTEIKVDQGATVADYVSPTHLFIPENHNLDVALTLEYNDQDLWTGSQTEVTLSEDTPTPGEAFLASFTQVVAGSGNKWWRLSFTKTDDRIQIPELWVTEKITLGQSETDPGRFGGASSPAKFPKRRNAIIHRTLGGVRSAVKLSEAMREFQLSGRSLSPASYTDWENFLEGTDLGVRPFLFFDVRGNAWFAEMELSDQSVARPELWTVDTLVREVL